MSQMMYVYMFEIEKRNTICTQVNISHGQRTPYEMHIPHRHKMPYEKFNVHSGELESFEYFIKSCLSLSLDIIILWYGTGTGCHSLPLPV